MPDKPWLNFAVAYTSLLAFAFVFQALPPVLPLILKELSLDHTKGGLLMSLFALPGILLTIPAGWLTDRYGIKRVGSAALVIMLAGTGVSATAGGFPALAAGRLIAGVGAMVLIIAAASLVTGSFSGRELGIAMGFYNTGVPVGTIVSFNVSSRIGALLGWRPAIMIPGVIIVLALALLNTRVRIGVFGHRGGIWQSVKTIDPRMWWLGLTWLFFNAAAISFLTFGPDFFIGLGYAIAGASLMASLLMWGALAVSPAIGPLMTGVRRKIFLILAGSVVPAAIYLVTPAIGGRGLLPLMVLLGLASALLPAPLFAMPGQIVRREQQGMAFGILGTFLNVGVLLGPLLVGVTRDTTGAYRAGFLLMALFSALAAASIAPLLKTGRIAIE